jgi:hypothetical protein
VSQPQEGPEFANPTRDQPTKANITFHTPLQLPCYHLSTILYLMNTVCSPTVYWLLV